MENLFDLTWGWIIGGLILAGLEIAIPGVFLMWIGLGAIATGVVLALFPDLPFAWQALFFAVLMLSSLGLGFMIQRQSNRTPETQLLNHELQAMIGRRYVAITPFAAGRGRIKVQDSSFAAISDEEIAEGDLVEVVAIADGRPQVVKRTA
ncbi:NfeD family protein [Futiania mangrovi]|uniref:NfeD family protein n=1 Tax=Futiania mangrovi TaxID=2959716 RepID=A0A9J6P805_9PROT|nr:NfeD family protein [Futiania mangrovii]MCP1335564.1 NfeD family protein [Futiania mangrovii]